MNSVYQYKAFSRKDEYYWCYIDELIKETNNITTQYNYKNNEKVNNIILLLINCINLYYNMFNKRTKISEELRNNNKKHYYDDYTYSDILSWTKIIQLLETHYNNIIMLANMLCNDTIHNEQSKHVKLTNKYNIIDDEYEYLLDIEKYINTINEYDKNNVIDIVNNILYEIINLETNVGDIIRYSEKRTYDILCVHIDYTDYNILVYNAFNKLFINHWKYVKNVIDDII